MWRPICIALALYSVTALRAAQSDEGRPLDLSHYKLIFDEHFSQLDVSAWGSGTRWIAHTPWNGDFGDAQFADPIPGFPFTISDGVLRIEAQKGSDGKWQSGLLASQDSEGHGFAVQYGYFEMRAKLPSGPGLWPAFWLDSMPAPGSSDPSVEIDVIEHYGKFPGAYNSTVIVWPHAKDEKNRAETHIQAVQPDSLYEQFHTYGVLVDPEWITVYFDRVETWRVRTPLEHKHPLMILVDLGLGSGWPIDKTPTPSYMYIEYIRTYMPQS